MVETLIQTFCTKYRKTITASTRMHEDILDYKVQDLTRGSKKPAILTITLQLNIHPKTNRPTIMEAK